LLSRCICFAYFISGLSFFAAGAYPSAKTYGCTAASTTPWLACIACDAYPSAKPCSYTAASNTSWSTFKRR
jgi:hypothetical protein